MGLGLGRLLHAPGSLLDIAIRTIKISAFLEVALVEDYLVAHVDPLFEALKTDREYRNVQPALRKFISKFYQYFFAMLNQYIISD